MDKDSDEEILIFCQTYLVHFISVNPRHELSHPRQPPRNCCSATKTVDEELVASAIAGVIKIVRSQGQSLEELTAQVLADDPMLDKQQRRWLCKVVAQAWESFT